MTLTVMSNAVNYIFKQNFVSAYPCLLSAEIKGMSHYRPAHFLCYNKICKAEYFIHETGLLACILKGCKTKVKWPLGLVSGQGLLSEDNEDEAVMTEITW